MRPNLQKNNEYIKTTEGRPRKYYYTNQSDAEEVAKTEENSSGDKSSYSEHDLYPILKDYLNIEHELYVKRIDEKRSNNDRGPNGNKWLYPDLVAMEDLTNQLSSNVKKFAKEYGGKKAKLWSFEVKILINLSNIRSAFFQAVSNSSWANFGYLVANELDAKAAKELTMLSSLHGIGFILLDIENSADSQIIIPAKERSDIDWQTINRIAIANKDFSNYIDEVSDFYLRGKTKKSDWD